MVHWTGPELDTILDMVELHKSEAPRRMWRLVRAGLNKLTQPYHTRSVDSIRRTWRKLATEPIETGIYTAVRHARARAQFVVIRKRNMDSGRPHILPDRRTPTSSLAPTASPSSHAGEISRGQETVSAAAAVGKSTAMTMPTLVCARCALTGPVQHQGAYSQQAALDQQTIRILQAELHLQQERQQNTEAFQSWVHACALQALQERHLRDQQRLREELRLQHERHLAEVQLYRDELQAVHRLWASTNRNF